MNKLICTTLILFSAVGFAQAQFPANPIQWPTPDGGSVIVSSPDSLVQGFYWFSNQEPLLSQRQEWAIEDMNGDGKPDLVVTGVNDGMPGGLHQLGAGVNGSSPYWMVYYNTGNGFSTTGTNWPTPAGGNGYFYHGTDSVSLGFSSVSNNSNGAFDQIWCLVDMNGDGKPDLVVTGFLDSITGGNYPTQFGVGNNPYWQVYLNTGTGFSATAINWHTPVGGDTYPIGFQLPVGFNNISGTPIAANDVYWDLRDLDGDGKPDLVVTGVFNGAGDSAFTNGANFYWKAYLNTGTGFSSTATNWPTPKGEAYVNGTDSTYNGFIAVYNRAQSTEGRSWDLRDMDGDGKPDLVATSYYNTLPAPGHAAQFGLGGSPYWKVYLNTGTGFATTAVQWPTPTGVSSYRIGGNIIQQGFWADSNGYALLNAGIGNNNDIWNLKDLNGDGKPDLVVTGYYDSLFERHNSIYGAGTNPNWRVYYNTGTGFSTSAFTWAVPQGGAYFFNGSDSIVEGFYQFAVSPVWGLQDMNGDGTPDLVVTGYADSVPVSGVTEFGPVGGRYWNVYLNSVTGIPVISNAQGQCLLYPNPNTGSFTLQFADVAEREIAVYDALGRLVLAPTKMQGERQFNLVTVNPGIYLLRFTQNDVSGSLRFIVAR